MSDGERLVAEQEVAVQGDQKLNVRISHHPEEQFWRVEVTNAAGAGRVNATVGCGDSFLMNLIEEAVRGEPAAWNHLAQWGRSARTRPSAGLLAPGG